MIEIIKIVACAGCATLLAGNASAAWSTGAGRGPAARRLVAVAPSAALRGANKPYGFKAYRYTDGTNTVQCLHYAPKARSTKGLPLVVYIPGNGERGDLVNQFRQRTLFDRVTSRKFQAKHPCHLIAVSPSADVGTLAGGLPGAPNAYQRLMHDMIFACARQAVPRVDLERVYVTGFSYGGDGAYALALHYPRDFAAAVPIAAVPPLEMYFTPTRPPNVWDIYNEGDSVASARSTAARRRFRELTNAAGGDFRLSTFPAAGHDAWNKAWREEEVWDWMFAKSCGKRQAPGARPSSVGARLALTDAKCTASLAGRDAACGPERVLAGLDEPAYIAERDFRKNDWWCVEFARPVSGRVCLYSGRKNGANRLHDAFVEVSSNGRNWRRVGLFSPRDGTCSFTAAQGFTHLRVRLLDDRPQKFMLRRLTLAAAR